MPCGGNADRAAFRRKLGERGARRRWKYPILVAGDELHRHRQLLEGLRRQRARGADTLEHAVAEILRREVRDLPVELVERRLLPCHALAGGGMDALFGE